MQLSNYGQWLLFNNFLRTKQYCFKDCPLKKEYSKNKIKLSHSYFFTLVFNFIKPTGYPVYYSFLIYCNSVVNHQVLWSSSFDEPLFMLLMNLFKIIQGDSILSFSWTFLDPIGADFRWTLNVDYTCQIDDRVHAHEMIIEL